MIDLQYAGTHDGDTMLWFPYAGHLFYFRETGPSSLVLERVKTCDGVSRRWDADAAKEDLPRCVRQAIADHGGDYRERATTVTEAMG